MYAVIHVSQRVAGATFNLDILLISQGTRGYVEICTRGKMRQYKDGLQIVVSPPTSSSTLRSARIFLYRPAIFGGARFMCTVTQQ